MMQAQVSQTRLHLLTIKYNQFLPLDVLLSFTVHQSLQTLLLLRHSTRLLHYLLPRLLIIAGTMERMYLLKFTQIRFLPVRTRILFPSLRVLHLLPLSPRTRRLQLEHLLRIEPLNHLRLTNAFLPSRLEQNLNLLMLDRISQPQIVQKFFLSRPSLPQPRLESQLSETPPQIHQLWIV